MLQNKYIFIGLSMLAGFVGGFVSNGVFSYAQAGSSKVISAQNFELVDSTGKVTSLWTTCENSPCLNFMDANGKTRLQFALYNDGLPVVGLYNEKFEAKALLRLFGGNQAPVLVMKNNNRDRMIMGLDLSNATEPFLVHFDDASQKHLEFGNY